MTFTEYAKNNKYVVVYGIKHEKGETWNSNWKDLHEIWDLSYLKFDNDKPRIFEAILEEKPKLSFEDIQELITKKFGYGYFRIDDISIKEEITKDQTALDIINNILANQLILYPSYTSGEQIELTDEELEEFCNISKGV